MADIYVEACKRGLMDERNSFKLRMNPSLVMALELSTCRLMANEYAYNVGSARIIADSTVETYKIESL